MGCFDLGFERKIWIN